MSDINWTQEQILLFLETLQSEPVIWDPNERGHKDKKKVNDAWLRIKEILKIPTEDLKKKKESLIATYRGYNRKKEASIKSGAGVDEVYRPVWFAYEFMDSFLGSVYKCKKTVNTDQNIVTTLTEEEERDASWPAGPITSPAPSDTQNSMEASNPTTAQNKTTRRRLNPPELQIASKQMSEAFNNLNKVMNRTAKDDVEDEYDVFGKLIAKKLKKLPEDEREDLMFEIHALFRKPRRVERSSSIESFCSSTPNTPQLPTYSEKYNPFIQIPSTSSIKIKRPKSANYPSTTMASSSPRPYSSLSDSPYTFTQFSDQSNERQYILHIPQSNESASLNQNTSMIHIISDEVVRPAENISTVIIPNVTQTQSVPDHNTDLSDILRQAYHTS